MQVKVHNLNIHPYSEKFRDQTITIPAGGFVEMDEDEAQYFMESFTFPQKDAQGRPDPLHFKKLQIERPAGASSGDADLICHANGQKAASVEDLNEIMKGFKSMLHRSAEEDVSAKQAAKLQKENKELKERLERLESHLGLTASTKGAVA